MSNTLFVHLSRWSISSKFLFKEHPLIWHKARDLCLSGNFKAWIWSMSWNLELTTFSGSLFFSGEVLLNWLHRRARSEGGFSESKLSLSLSLLVLWEKEFVVVMEEMKSLFVFQKEKCYCNKRDSTMDHLSLGDICSLCD